MDVAVARGRRLDAATGLLVGALLACLVLAADATDPDLWWHLRLGHWMLDNHSVATREMFSYTAAGNALVAHEWLTEVLYALLDSAGGLLLVVVVMALVGWSALVAITLRCRALGATPIATLLAVLAVAKVAQPVLGTRPQVITLALLAWTLLLIERHLRVGDRRVLLLIPLGAVWANLHAGFAVGIGCAALVLAVAATERARHAAALRTLATAVTGMALAACLNPQGPGLYRFALTVSSAESRKPIVEWHSPDFHDPTNWALLGLIAGLCLLSAAGARARRIDAVLATVGLAAALVAVRNSGLAAVLCAPALATMLSAVGRGHGLPMRTSGRLLAGLGLIGPVAAFAVLAGQASTAQIALRLPSCSVAALAGDGRQHRVFVPYGEAGFLIDRLWPTSSVFEYGESISLGEAVFSDYLTVAAGADGALGILDRTATDSVLTPPGALARHLDAAGWQVRGADRNGDLFYVRASSSAALDCR